MFSSRCPPFDDVPGLDDDISSVSTGSSSPPNTPVLSCATDVPSRRCSSIAYISSKDLPSMKHHRHSYSVSYKRQSFCPSVADVNESAAESAYTSSPAGYSIKHQRRISLDDGQVHRRLSMEHTVHHRRRISMADAPMENRPRFSAENTDSKPLTAVRKTHWLSRSFAWVLVFSHRVYARQASTKLKTKRLRPLSLTAGQRCQVPSVSKPKPRVRHWLTRTLLLAYQLLARRRQETKERPRSHLRPLMLVAGARLNYDRTVVKGLPQE